MYSSSNFLDASYQQILAGSIHEGMHTLFMRLQEIRLTHSLEEWREFVQKIVMPHPVRSIVHKDPFTLRAFEKPRGYAGDAVMMDMIYFQDLNRHPNHYIDSISNEIFMFTTNAPSAKAVRNRRYVAANLIDKVAGQTDSPRIFAVAAGHLREFEISCIAQMRKFSAFFAMDQDAESLREIEQSYGHLGVQCVNSSIRGLLTNRIDLSDFDLVYALGLYDYLEQRLAQRLTSNLFSRLRSGGKLLLANFIPEIQTVGYMESFMEWNLIYRTESMMENLLTEIKQEQIGGISLFLDDQNNIAFLEVAKL